MKKYFDVQSYLEQLNLSDNISMCDTVPIPDILDNQNYLFISYAHQDYKKVYADLAIMYREGVRFWYDRGLRAGKNWDSEVKDIIENPRCSGVIFFISESMFLSKSVNQEIDLVIGEEKQPRKNYFCVNLSEEQPSRILRSILRMEDEVIDLAGLDMDRISVLSRAFRDQQTYLSFSDIQHEKQLLDQICNQFDVVNSQKESRGYFTITGRDEKIYITEDMFMIGKDNRFNHYVISNDSYVSRQHMCVICGSAGVMISDSNTMNGTCVNGKRIPGKEPVMLKDMDEIRIGQNTVLIYHED